MYASPKKDCVENAKGGAPKSIVGLRSVAGEDHAEPEGTVLDTTSANAVNGKMGLPPKHVYPAGQATHCDEALKPVRPPEYVPFAHAIGFVLVAGQ